VRTKILVFGDVFGRVGRRIVKEQLPELRKKFAPDFMVANAENLTGGKGPSIPHAQEMLDLGFDVLTGGNHSFARLGEIAPFMDAPGSRLIRPANYFETPDFRVPGRGYAVVEKNGKKLAVLNLMSGLFLKDQMDNPFLAADKFFKDNEESGFDAALVDFHREATSESYCMAQLLDGRATLVYGTHTHVQTNDETILPGGTGFICDVGMTGPKWSSIGQTFPGRLAQCLTGTRLFGGKVESVTEGPGALHALYVETQDGRCVGIEKVRVRE
jgi:metallophosphoesterase (TIGR00282 family)